MYRVLPPFWLRANAGRIVVSSCASDLSIEAARELAAALDEVIAAAVAQEAAKSQASLPTVIVPPFESAADLTPGAPSVEWSAKDDADTASAGFVHDRKRDAAGDAE